LPVWSVAGEVEGAVGLVLLVGARGHSHLSPAATRAANSQHEQPSSGKLAVGSRHRGPVQPDLGRKPARRRQAS
jgi:hypothetical protein